MKKIKCACGCNKLIEPFDSRNRPKKFIQGHQSKGTKKGKYIPCKTCQKIIYRYPILIKKIKNSFCSRKCFYKYPHYWQREENHYLWKGGQIKINGYIYILKKNRPKIGGKYIKRSRLLIEKYIGRKLKRSEIIHHIDNNKTNDTINNIKITTISNHGKIHRPKGSHSLYK